MIKRQGKSNSIHNSLLQEKKLVMEKALRLASSEIVNFSTKLVLWVQEIFMLCSVQMMYFALMEVIACCHNRKNHGRYPEQNIDQI